MGLDVAYDTPWIARSAPARDAGLRLVCLPYAGGGASAYRAWPARMPDVDVLAIQPPGRETRMLEAPLNRVGPFVQELADALQPALSESYAVFGHSMGARVGFELVRELRRRGERLPFALLVSACKAPHLPRAPLPLFEEMPAPVQIARLRAMNGTPPEVLENPELLDLLLPAIRADFGLLDHYAYVDEPALPCPIRVFGGSSDSEAREDDLLAWQAHTMASFSLTMLPAGHFTIVTHEREMTEMVAAELRTLATAEPA